MCYVADTAVQSVVSDSTVSSVPTVSTALIGPTPLSSLSAKQRWACKYVRCHNESISVRLVISCSCRTKINCHCFNCRRVVTPPVPCFGHRLLVCSLATKLCANCCEIFGSGRNSRLDFSHGLDLAICLLPDTINSINVDDFLTAKLYLSGIVCFQFLFLAHFVEKKV